MEFEVVAVGVETGKVQHLDNFGANEEKAKALADALNAQFEGAVRCFVVAQKTLDKSEET